MHPLFGFWLFPLASDNVYLRHLPWQTRNCFWLWLFHLALTTHLEWLVYLRDAPLLASTWFGGLLLLLGSFDLGASRYGMLAYPL